jgi:hypothetical protein
LAPLKLTSPPENRANMKSPQSKTAPVKSKFKPCQDTAADSFEMRGNNAGDRTPDFAKGLEGLLLRLGSILARIGWVRHAHIGAEHVNAGLPVSLPVISQSRHGVHPS